MEERLLDEHLPILLVPPRDLLLELDLLVRLRKQEQKQTKDKRKKLSRHDIISNNQEREKERKKNGGDADTRRFRAPNCRLPYCSPNCGGCRSPKGDTGGLAAKRVVNYVNMYLRLLLGLELVHGIEGVVGEVHRLLEPGDRCVDGLAARGGGQVLLLA